MKKFLSLLMTIVFNISVAAFAQDKLQNQERIMDQEKLQDQEKIKDQERLKKQDQERDQIKKKKQIEKDLKEQLRNIRNQKKESIGKK